MAAVIDSSILATVKQKVHWTDRIGHLVLIAIAVALLVFLAAPLAAILMQSVENKAGAFVGLDNFIAYVQTPALKQSLWNSVWVSAVVTLIAVPAAFLFAYASSAFTDVTSTSSELSSPSLGWMMSVRRRC